MYAVAIRSPGAGIDRAAIGQHRGSNWHGEAVAGDDGRQPRVGGRQRRGLKRRTVGLRQGRQCRQLAGQWQCGADRLAEIDAHQSRCGQRIERAIAFGYGV